MNRIKGSMEPFAAAPRWLEVGVGAVLVVLVFVSLAFAITGMTFLPGADFRRSHLTALRVVAVVAGVALAPLVPQVLAGRGGRPDGSLFSPALLYVAASVSAVAGAGSLLLPGMLKLHALEGIAGAIGCLALARYRAKRTEV